MTAEKGDWNPPELWRIFTCIMMIRADRQNKEIMFAGQCSLNTEKIWIEGYNGNYETFATKNQHKRRPDSVCSSEFLKTLMKNVVKDPSIGIRTLSRELNVKHSTIKLFLNKDSAPCHIT